MALQMQGGGDCVSRILALVGLYLVFYIGYLMVTQSRNCLAMLTVAQAAQSANVKMFIRLFV